MTDSNLFRLSGIAALLDGFGWAGIVFAAGWICAGLTLIRRKDVAGGNTA